MTSEAETPGNLKAISRATVVLACLAATVALHLGRAFLVPIALAVLVASLLEPLVRLLRRAHLPAPLAATIVVLGSLAALAAAGFALEQPMRDLASEMPNSIARARVELRKVTAPLARIGITPFGAPPRRPARGDSPPPGAADSAARSEPSPTPAESPPAPPRDSSTASGSAPSAPADVTAAAGQAVGATLSALAEIMEVLLLTLLLLAGGDRWGQEIERAIASPEKRARAREATSRMRAVVVRYMVATALINLGQGLLVAGVAWRAGLPSPALWGVLTFVAEFIPYLGGAAMVVLLLLAGFAGTGGVAHALIAPIAYLVITTVQNNVVSPVAYGRGLRLDAAMILVAVIVWYTLWGIAGVFLAVPIMASVRILSEYVDVLAPLGRLLGE